MEELLKIINLWHADFCRLDVCDQVISEFLNKVNGTDIEVPNSFEYYDYDRSKDFEKILEQTFPNYRFAYTGDEWILLTKV